MSKCYGSQRFRAWRSGGFEALTCPQALKFIRCTNVEFTTSPAIAAKPVLQAGVLVFRVLQPLSILSFATHCPNVFVSVCVLEFLKFFRREGIFLKQFFSGWRKAYSFCSFGLCADLRGCKMCMLLRCGLYVIFECKWWRFNVCACC